MVGLESKFNHWIYFDEKRESVENFRIFFPYAASPEKPKEFSSESTATPGGGVFVRPTGVADAIGSDDGNNEGASPSHDLAKAEEYCLDTVSVALLWLFCFYCYFYSYSCHTVL